MLIHDFSSIGSKLHTIRKKLGLTQMDVAESAGLAPRTYADIERGTANMRVETFLRICEALHVTPDALLTVELSSPSITPQDLLDRLQHCNEQQLQTALRLLEVYLNSLL